MKFFEYGEHEINWLKNQDETLGAFIDKTGKIYRKVYPEPFTGLCRAIIGQQLGGSALESIWSRFIASFPHPEPEILADTDIEKIKQCGLSLAKAKAIKLTASYFVSGELANLFTLSEKEISAKLLPIKGIGQWTVDMLLIFGLQRKNIASYGDFALKKGLCRLYGHTDITKDIFTRHMEIYAPYATIASFYLWEAAAGKK